LIIVKTEIYNIGRLSQYPIKQENQKKYRRILKKNNNQQNNQGNPKSTGTTGNRGQFHPEQNPTTE